jgi:ABC-type antimicrobial peptide transport system permease subunit
LGEYVDRAVAPRRFVVSLLLAFAALALICAALGLYGVVAYDVHRRTRDIGIRLAVGASQEEVVRSVLLGGLRLGAAGIAAGLVLGALAVRGLGGLVFGVGLGDPLTWAGSVLLVSTVTVAATWIPAWRASRLSPTLALQAE